MHIYSYDIIIIVVVIVVIHTAHIVCRTCPKQKCHIRSKQSFQHTHTHFWGIFSHFILCDDRSMFQWIQKKHQCLASGPSVYKQMHCSSVHMHVYVRVCMFAFDALYVHLFHFLIKIDLLIVIIVDVFLPLIQTYARSKLLQFCSNDEILSMHNCRSSHFVACILSFSIGIWSIARYN